VHVPFSVNATPASESEQGTEVVVEEVVGQGEVHVAVLASINIVWDQHRSTAPGIYVYKR